jgi:hypothetical protein
MNFRKAILFGIGLSMLAALTACSSGSKSPTSSTTITANAGYTASATVGGSFGTFAVTVMQNGAPLSGASVTFTSPSAADGTFAGGTNNGTTIAATTGANGVATSAAFTAGTLAGAYTVTATVSGATTPASFGLSNTAGTAATLAISSPSSGSESAAVSSAFGALAVLVTDSDSNPVAGASVTFTVTPGGGGASAAFSGATPLTDAEMTGSNGIATTSQTLTANSTTGAFTVVVTSGSLTPVSFNLTNTASTGGSGLAAGNYVFSVGGADSGSAGNGYSPYYAAGVFQVNSSGGIVTGIMDFSDFNYFASGDSITGGSVAASPTQGDTNLIITLNTGDTNIGPGATTAGSGSGTIVFSVSMASSTRGLMSEFDTWATSSGELNAQTTTSLCPNVATTPCGYSLYIAGLDTNGFPINLGGVFVNDSAGAISGGGSVFDVNDEGTLIPGSTFSASSVTPQSMGFVTFTLNSSALPAPAGVPGILLDGYVVDANHIRVIENWTQDYLNATTGGTLLTQQGTVGGFSGLSVAGSSYVFSTAGGTTSTGGGVQVAGVLTFQTDGSVTGNLSWNDLSGYSAQGGVALAAESSGAPCSGGTAVTPCYTVDPTGRVTITNLTDSTSAPTFNYNLQLYLDGDGHATVISMDAADVLAGLLWQQGAGTLNASQLSGTYSMDLAQINTSEEWANAVGSFNATGSGGTLSGFLDQNGVLAGGALASFGSIGAGYTATSTNGVLNINPTGGGSTLLTGYLIDGTQGVVIESDNQQLTLGYFTNQ